MKNLMYMSRGNFFINPEFIANLNIPYSFMSLHINYKYIFILNMLQNSSKILLV